MPTNYENARSTVLLATRCIACNRPLCDATSVEAGMGPICRERYGYNQEIPNAVRVQANQLIHEAALDATSTTRRLEIASAIRQMGLTILADKIEERFDGGTVSITYAQQVLGRAPYQRRVKCFVVNTPYCRERTSVFNNSLKSSIDWTTRAPVWTTENGRRSWGGWAIEATDENKRLIWDLVRSHWTGFSIKNDKGERSTIPALISNEQGG